VKNKPRLTINRKATSFFIVSPFLNCPGGRQHAVGNPPAC
jgi:hypothetical protein